MQAGGSRAGAVRFDVAPQGAITVVAQNPGPETSASAQDVLQRMPYSRRSMQHMHAQQRSSVMHA